MKKRSVAAALVAAVLFAAPAGAILFSTSLIHDLSDSAGALTDLAGGLTDSSGGVFASIVSVSLASNDYNSGSPAGTDLGPISVATTGPAFTGMLALSGTDAADFSINPINNHLITASTLVSRPYNFTVTATQPGARGSPFSQPAKIIDGLSDCSSAFTYTYTATTGACSTNDPSGCNGMSSTLAATNTPAQNDAALSSFNSEAQRHTRPAETGYAGGANGANNAYTHASRSNCVVFNIGAGTFQTTNPEWPFNIRHIFINGAGVSSTSIQNTFSGVNNAMAEELNMNIDMFGAPAGAAKFGYFINSANIGDTQVTIDTAAGESAASAGNFFVGRWVLVASWNQQYDGGLCGSSGYPPNFRYYDYAEVTGTNATTGVITLDRPLTWAHLSTRPYTGTFTAGVNGSCGPARVIPIDTPAKPIQEYAEVSGIHFLSNPNWNSGNGSQLQGDQAQIAGEIDGYFDNVQSNNAMAFSQSRDLNIEGSTWIFDEADKIIRKLVYESDTVGNLTTAGAGTYHHAGEQYWGTIGGSLSFGTGVGASPNTGTYSININGTSFNLTKANFNGGVTIADDWDSHDLTVENSTFTGNSCQSGGVSNCPAFTVGAPLNDGITVDGSTVKIGNNPAGGTNNRLIVARSNWSCSGCSNPGSRIAENWQEGEPLWRSNAFVAGCALSSVSADTTNIYADFPTGCSFSTSQFIWIAELQTLTVENNTGISTGFTNWASGTGLTSNGIIHYPNGSPAVPTITWSGNNGG